MPVIFWSRWGWLVPVIVFGCALACQIIADRFLGEGYYSDHYWTVAAALLAAAPIVWAIGYSLHKQRFKTVIDEATGAAKVSVEGKHTFFFVPMDLRGHMLFLASLALFILELVSDK